MTVSMDAPDNESARSLGTDQKQFNTLFERMMDGFAYHKIILDKSGNPVDYIFLEVNNAFEQLTGLKREAIIGRKATEVIPGLASDPADWIGVYGRVAITGISTQFENYATPLDRWYRVNAYCPTKGYFVALFEEITARKKAEKQIAEQAFMLENANDAIIGYSFDQKITFWNKAAEELYGYKSEEILGRMGADLLKPVYVNVKREQLFDRLMSEGRTESESTRLTKNGRRVDIEAHVILLRDEAAKPIGYVSVDRDITERKKNEEALRKSNERLELVSSIASQLLSTTRPQTLIQELCEKVMKFLDCDVFFNFLVDEHREKLHLNAYAGVPPETAKTFEWLSFGEAVCGCAAQEGKRIVCENIPDTNDHRTALVRSFGVKAYAAHPLFSEGKVIGTLSFGSERRATFAEDELSLMKTIAAQVSVAMTRQNTEEALEKQAALIDLSPDAIIIRNRDGEITLWSRGAETMYGWSRDEAVGKITHQLLKTEFPMPLNEIMVQVASRGQWTGELTHTKKDGRKVCVRSHWLGRFDINKENVLEILETNVDITERKQMLDKLEDYTHNLETLVEYRTKEATTERERLYQVLETLPAYVILLDKDYKVPFANKVFRERFGEDKGRHCYDFLFNRTSPCENCETYKVLETGKPHHWEWTGPDKRDYDIYDYPFKAADGSTQILEMGIDVTERKKAEAAVQTERKRLFSVLETMPQMICLLTPDYHVAFANRAFREKFGESQGRHCYEYCYGKKEPCTFCESYEVLKTGKPRHWEVTTEDGSIIDANDFPFTDADGSPLILEVDSDITVQRQAERKLQDVSLYTRSLLEAALDPLVTISAEGKITDVNEPSIRATGRSRQELVGSDFSDYFTEPDKARTGYLQVFAKGHVRDYPLAIRHKSGKVMDVLYNAGVYRNEAGEIQGVFAAARDVTERKRYEERLHAASLYSRSLLESSLDPLVTISADGRITDVNEATVQATGCSREELVGSDFCDYFTQPKKAREGYKRVFTFGHVVDYPLTIKHKSGKTIDVLYNASVYRNEKGEVQGVFAAARDVTELNKYREHLEELVEESTKALRESQEKLELKAAEVEEYATNMEALAEERALKLKDAERLAAIGATAGMVGHDIRNPLQAIIGDVFLAQSDVNSLPASETKDSIIESLNSIQKSVDYVNKIVQDLQDYAKPIRPSVCDTNFNSIIEDVIKRNGIPENVKLQRRLTKGARTIKVDPDLLRRIIGNLVNNAIQAMPEGGKLTIHAQSKKRDVVITVKDTGHGIPEAAKANLFTPLFTTKSKGQGFGLAVVKRMTEAMGGTVTFESEVGKGAEFIIRLPQ